MNVTSVARLDLRFSAEPWAFANERRADIDAFFAERQRANPRLWNGRVLLLHRCDIDDGVLHGTFLETDYASMLSWLSWDRPPADIFDCFGAAVVTGSDGAVLLGKMAAHTANAGRIYFPCGTPDRSDVVGEVVDFDRSIARELAEETGLNADDFAAEPGWTLVQDQARVVAFKTLRAAVPGAALREAAERHLAKHPDGELTAIRLARTLADLDPAMPDYVVAFLKSRWQ